MNVVNIKNKTGEKIKLTGILLGKNWEGYNFLRLKFKIC